MQKFMDHDVYTKVPISECIRLTGKQPSEGKSIDISNGDAKSPNYRSRLVAKEIKRGPSDEMFAATPPLVVSRWLTSRAASQGGRGPGKKQLMALDFSKAFLYGDVQREIYI